MSNARNLARLLPNASGQLPDSNLANIATSKLSGSIPTSSMPSGTVLQVSSITLTAVSSTTETNSTSTGGDVGLNVSITPLSSNSKFLVTLIIGIGSSAGNTWCGILTRDGTKVGNSDATSDHPPAWFRGVNHAGSSGSDTNHGVGASGYFMDTTSGTAGVSRTYRVGLVGESSPTWINRCQSDYTTGNGTTVAPAVRGSTTMTVMEIVK